MAFASLRDSGSGACSSDGTNDRFGFTLPASISLLDLVVWFIGCDDDEVNTEAWVDLDGDGVKDSLESRSTNGTGQRYGYCSYICGESATTLHYGWFMASGEEGGKTFYVQVADGSEPAWYICYVWQDHGVTKSAPATAVDKANRVAASAASDITPTTNPDVYTCPIGFSLTSADYVWIAAEANDHSDTLSSYPTNFDDNQKNARGTGSGDAGVAAATRNYTGTTHDPDWFVISGSEEWGTVHLAIPPEAGEPPTPGDGRYNLLHVGQ